jgi:hypothetical protein
MAGHDNNDPKYVISYTGGHDDDTRRATLEEAGPLTVSAEHWLVTSRPEALGRDDAGTYTYTMHHLEHVWLDVLDWPNEALERGFHWFLRPEKASRFLQEAGNNGALRWEHFKSEEMMVVHLRECKDLLPPAMRGFTTDDMVAYDIPSPITRVMDRVRAVMLTNEGRNTPAVDFKSMLSDAYIQERRESPDGHHQSMIDVMLDAASPATNLGGKSLAVQASTLCRFTITSQPPRGLRRYHPYEMQEQEIARRALDESGRFVPLLTAAWDNDLDGGYPELRATVKHPCDGETFIAYIKFLAIRAKMTEAITSTTCSALCDMLRGETLAELSTDEMQRASSKDRCSKAGDALAAAASKPQADKLAAGTDKAAAEKMRASAPFISMIASMEALISDTPDYKSVIKILAGTAVGRIYINSGTSASPVMLKFAAARHTAELDLALNAILSVDESGKTLGKTAVKAGMALKLIQGKFAAAELDPWTDICKPVIIFRDGNEAANIPSTDRASFWSDHTRLVLAEPILREAMHFIGYTGRAAGSFISFHAGMTKRARQVDCLPNTFLKKNGLRKMLASIGAMVMTAAAGKDGTMLREAVGVAHIRSPFFPTGSLACSELTLFDNDLAEARSKARLHDDYGDDEEGNFRPTHDDSWRIDQTGQAKRFKTPTYQGSKLDSFSVYLTKHGLLYGGKFLVIIDVSPDMIPHDTCLGCMSYFRLEDRRAEWCSKRNCTHHRRPAQLSEDKFHIINIYAADNSAEDKAKAQEVLDAQDTWQHWGGAKNRDVMGGKGGRSTNKLAVEAAASRARDDSRPSEGRGKGRGRSIGKGKGKGGGKGKGKGKGKGPPNFGRQR